MAGTGRAEWNREIINVVKVKKNTQFEFVQRCVILK